LVVGILSANKKMGTIKFNSYAFDFILYFNFIDVFQFYNINMFLISFIYI